jgi:hypothetical protein
MRLSLRQRSLRASAAEKNSLRDVWPAGAGAWLFLVGLLMLDSRMSGACGPPHARMMITVGCRCTLRPCSSRHRAIARVEKCKDDAETGAHHGGNAHTPAAHHPLRFFRNASRLIEYPQP